MIIRCSPRPRTAGSAAEIIALLSGGAVLSATGETAYTIAWFALIAGAHFLLFGRAFWSGFSAADLLLAGAWAVLRADTP